MAISTRIAAELPRGIMLTTESGLIPYYTDWIAYDTWGLNTKEFARSMIAPSDVAKVNPDLIIVHPASTPGTLCKVWKPTGDHEKGRSWVHMTDNILEGIDSSKYILWRIPYLYYSHKTGYFAGDSAAKDANQECWFVSRNYVGAKRLAEILKSFGGVTNDDLSPALPN